MSLKPIIYCLALLAPVLSGCSDSHEKLVHVSGTVYIDDKPLHRGMIRLVGATSRPAKGEIGPEGQFVLETFEEGDGSALGNMHVVVNALEPIPGGQRWLVPKKYASPTTTDKQVVIDGPTDSLEIRLSWEGKQPYVEQFSGPE